ncbi:MAG: DUF6691 family protein [Paracoccaceae bacterium]|nr:DUF6691 family protein [Paracoccaceae bacterium]
MKRTLFAALAGGLFGAGLLTSDMINTHKVQGWLDVFGDWDPTLAFVLIGAILPMVFAWRIAERRKVGLLGTPIPAKSDPKISADLALGSVLFGLGWGLVGLCPGPAIASISFGGYGGWVFLVAMGAGMLAAPPIRARIGQRTA